MSGSEIGFDPLPFWKSEKDAFKHSSIWIKNSVGMPPPKLSSFPIGEEKSRYVFVFF